jgi:3-oxoacyl-[acyl-carrier-protein] synthase-3
MDDRIRFGDGRGIHGSMNTLRTAAIRAIEYFLPETTLSTAQLAAEFPDWSVQKIESKTGISNRHIAATTECSSDLAVAAAEKLFASGACSPADIDYILLCTQSPDYFLPTTACLIQNRLGIPNTAGALDFNLGCSGFVTGLGLAKGLIETGQATNVLLLTAETYSKFIHPLDKSVRTIFGDAAAATLITAQQCGKIGPFIFGTDGSGGENLIVRTGAMRQARTAATAIETTDESGNVRSLDHLYMNGAEIFDFTLRRIPSCVDALLQRSSLGMDDIDLFVFHQANQYMLEHLRKKLKVPKEKFLIAMKDCGNTVSSTIPIALKQSLLAGKLTPGQRIMLVGFGVGYSWAAALVTWSAVD